MEDQGASERPNLKRPREEDSEALNGVTYLNASLAPDGEAAQPMDVVTAAAPDANQAQPSVDGPHPAAISASLPAVQVTAEGQVPASEAQPTEAQGTELPLVAAVDDTGTDAATAAAAVDAPVLPPDTYMSRELRHIDRENSGELSVEYAVNDNTPKNMKLLIGLKNVFSKCLPNMPRTYISRLLFERRHRSVVIVRSDGTVIGGIAYRPFYQQRFAEIAFCAIAQSLQVSGFGTRLMNWTKYYARQNDNCEYFLTYADNNAVGYFSKQGFTKQLTMPKDRWHGYIKDYDGGTLMECFIHPTLPFTNLPGMMSGHRAAVDKRVQQHSSGHIVRPGLDWWKEGKGAMNINDIPGVKESGWSSNEILAASTPKLQVLVSGKLVPPTPENLHAVMSHLLSLLDKEESLVWPFREPVDPKSVPDYLTIVKDPMDLSEVKKRLESRSFYVTVDIFLADVNRIFNNAKLYNAADTHYYKAAQKLSSMFSQWVNGNIIYD